MLLIYTKPELFLAIWPLLIPHLRPSSYSSARLVLRRHVLQEGALWFPLSRPSAESPPNLHPRPHELIPVPLLVVGSRWRRISKRLCGSSANRRFQRVISLTRTFTCSRPSECRDCARNFRNRIRLPSAVSHRLLLRQKSTVPGRPYPSGGGVVVRTHVHSTLEPNFFCLL